MSSDISMIPEVQALVNDDSMLTRKFGKEVVNYYAGSRLNRYSFLRADTAFLRRAAASPKTTFLALENLNPVTIDKRTLGYLTLKDVVPLIGEDPFKLSEKEAIEAYDSSVITPIIVFLGMLEDGEASDIESAEHGNIKGSPVFAVDITPKGSYADAAKALMESIKAKGWSVQERPNSMSLLPEAGKSRYQASADIQ